MSSTFLAIVALIVIVLTLWTIAYDIVTRRWDAMSWRNVFLIGFLHFFGFGCWWVANGYMTPGVPVRGDGIPYLAVSTALFFGTFMVTTWVVQRWRWPSRLLPKIEIPITGPAVIGSVIILLAIAFSGAAFVRLSYAGAIVAFFRGQLAATAVGLATYYFVARRFNPIAWTLFVSTLLTAVLIGVVGSSGRRLLLSSLLAVPWMWYFTVWRYRSAAPNFARVAVGMLVGFLAVLVYTPIRFDQVGKMGTGATIETRAGQLLDLVQHPLEALTSNVIDSVIYTDAPPNTLFIIENYPEQYSYTPLAGVLWMVSNPIPRAFWPDKPEALGVIIERQMSAPSNLGPGIIGHGWAEGGFLGVLAYAMVFGFIAAAIDRALAERSWNPFFIAAIGSNLGNVFGLARGDTPLFFLEFASGVVMSLLVLYIIKWTCGPIVAAFPPLALAPETPATDDNVQEPPDADPADWYGEPTAET